MRLKVPLFVIIVLTATFPIIGVRGDVPTVRQLEGTQSGDDILITVVIRHGSPSSNHYVNRVEVKLDGSTTTMGLSPQSGVTFTVNATFEDDEMGQMRARAFCTIHGWGQWKEAGSTLDEDVTVTTEEPEESVSRSIPGYQAESILMGAIGVIFLLWKSRRRY
ncbi:MAG: hypothetical protein JSV27_01185 [Candidatus Bathyarchaeota archaeon]|nr:MAG: hypothetical protein JSV27_01185 [Candidatus Bathyarchaeota archaeon]